MFTDFCGSGIWRGPSNKDRLSLLHNVWALRGKGLKLGLSQGLGAGTIWKLLHTHVWELMPAVGWYLSGVYGVEHEHLGLPMGLSLAHNVIYGF